MDEQEENWGDADSQVTVIVLRELEERPGRQCVDEGAGCGRETTAADGVEDNIGSEHRKAEDHRRRIPENPDRIRRTQKSRHGEQRRKEAEWEGERVEASKEELAPAGEGPVAEVVSVEEGERQVMIPPVRIADETKVVEERQPE